MLRYSCPSSGLVRIWTGTAGEVMASLAIVSTDVMGSPRGFNTFGSGERARGRARGAAPPAVLTGAYENLRSASHRESR